MVLESSMNIIGDQLSPHMSSMEGDVAKIDSIRGTSFINNNSHGNNAHDTSESREIGNTPVLSVISHNVATLSHGAQSPTAKKGDAIFREPLDSWSRVVVGGGGTPPPRSNSGETLLTSNAQQHVHPQVMHERSNSFPEHSSGDQVKVTPAFAHSHSWGMSHFHPAPPQAALATIQQGVEAPSTPLASPMLHSTNAQFKNYLSVTYSPLSIGESTGQTSATSLSPMSLSPHASPYVNPRSSGSSPSPPPWMLDANEFHSEPPTMRHNLHSRPPQSLNFNGTLSPNQHSSQDCNRHPLSSNTAHRPGPKPHTSSTPQVPLHQRSSTEVLKTLLRKKACLYEPETSHSISLVTWLVGRRLALSQGYFTRQQLQSGVHSCVAKKIDEGIVTRTKVNRCMQIILNSCFHYIIPRPDGSEENGEAFRLSFTGDAANDEHLLRSLPAPWNNLSLDSLANSESDFFNMSDDEGDDKRKSKERSDSLSLDSGGGKRSVLLCFNENVCSASDVFHCHNEFIRDVAHTANLNLSPEEWQSFFTGSRAYRKKPNSIDNFESGYSRMNQQSLSSFRTSWCAKRYEHDHAVCGFAHAEVNRGWLRRDPVAHKYKPLSCPNIKSLPGKEGCFINMCPRGVACEHAHSNEEIIYHLDNYKRLACKNSANSCPLRDVCPRVHTKQDMPHHHSHGYHRHGRRRHDNSPSQRPRSSSDAARFGGFGKIPDGSPMLYIDPAPLSEFEKTLLLPGLQAMFRDHSSSIFYSNKTNGNLCEYGLFGYKIKKSS
mmetsp:Transcript_29649/g.45871  ORF Transcript_29649/g.45871 Transcript_29649/m.45871 type:complete len:771 (-) Transcript_29649:142-2454(-)